MEGFDNNDQLRGYNHLRFKCHKYYKYVCWFLFDLMVTSSYILCRQYTNLPIKSIKSFGLLWRKSSSAITPLVRYAAAHVLLQHRIDFAKLTSQFEEQREAINVTTATQTKKDIKWYGSVQSVTFSFATTAEKMTVSESIMSSMGRHRTSNC